jgi:AraC family transcriptional regulator, regulatory protein of adaptative response / methylated-DNA-[protein]-cysteine methyltransferase
MSHSAVPFAEPDAVKWRAVSERDARADGQFVYGVLSTGIYCRPSCPSRPARPENLRFFDTGEAARKAGFRPCLRCAPDGPTPRARLTARVTEACQRIEASETLPSLTDLAEAAGISPQHFHRQFKEITGLTPRGYGLAHRARRLRDELKDPNASVTQAIYGAGYGSGSRFYEAADSVLGMTATRFRKGGAGAQIHFAIGASSLGAILVARTARGVCAILLDDDPEALVQDLQDRFPAAELIGDDAGFADLIARIIGFVEAPQKGLDLPLDLQGTLFQQRVWQALCEIPVGQTTSYSDIAARIGAPKAVRAVAGACAANKVALAVPCHRVVRQDGALSGYRWGIERKAELLRREAGR